MTMVSMVLSALLVLCGCGLQWFVESSRSADMNLWLASAPNFISAAFFGTLFSLCFFKAELRATAGFAAGLILYEFLQLAIPGRTFDVIDIVASVLGGVVSVCILFCYKHIGRIWQLGTET